MWSMENNQSLWSFLVELKFVHILLRKFDPSLDVVKSTLFHSNVIFLQWETSRLWRYENTAAEWRIDINFFIRASLSAKLDHFLSEPLSLDLDNYVVTKDMKVMICEIPKKNWIDWSLRQWRVHPYPSAWTAASWIVNDDQVLHALISHLLGGRMEFTVFCKRNFYDLFAWDRS
jgi:hypothetical protein